jgi:succinylglutamate desuccinylase
MDIIMSSIGRVPPAPVSASDLGTTQELQREIGRVVGDRPGPTVIAVGAIHGNERAGIHAARRAIARLSRNVLVRGEVVAFVGNLGACRAGRRYAVRDLNRVWTEAKVADLEARAAGLGALDPEEQEQLELLSCIRAAKARARGPVFLVDLHTTSAHGVPFVLFGDTLAQRELTAAIPLPLVFGLEEQVDGVLSSYWTRHGCTTFGVEGGQHDDPASVDNLEAALLLAIERAGVIAHGALPELGDARALLERRRGDLPHAMEVVRRHAISPEDAFKMEPGFRNLDFAKGAQLLARDARGEIRAPRDGFVILPLYQGLGDDGFFWGRALTPARIRVSTTLRRLGAERILPLLPGVARDTAVPSRLVVDTKVAKVYPRDVFHMFGYRRIRELSAVTTVERQPD